MVTLNPLVKSNSFTNAISAYKPQMSSKTNITQPIYNQPAAKPAVKPAPIVKPAVKPVVKPSPVIAKVPDKPMQPQAPQTLQTGTGVYLQNKELLKSMGSNASSGATATDIPKASEQQSQPKSKIDEYLEMLLQYSKPSEAEQGYMKQSADLKQGYYGGMSREEDRTIPMEFITGRQKSMENRYLQEQDVLGDRLGAEQANRTAGLDVAKTLYGASREDQQKQAEYENSLTQQGYTPYGGGLSGDFSFKQGMTPQQQKGIEALRNKPLNQWTGIDRDNFYYATGQKPEAYVPQTQAFKNPYTGQSQQYIPGALSGAVSVGDSLIDPKTGKAVYQQSQSMTPYQQAQVNLEQQKINQDKINQSKAGGLTPAQINSTVNSIAGAFDNEPIVKSYNIANEGYETISSIGVDTKSPADDIAFIYAFAKIMDPNSVVREGEYNTIQKYAQTWADNFGFKAKRVFSNTNFLSPDAKQKMLNALKPKIKTLEGQYTNLRSEYQRQIEDAYAGRNREITEYNTGSQQAQDDGWF